jgi:ADP-ribose pyrophosphatase
MADQLLPPNAKLVFKGVIFEVYQWEQELFDGSVATFEKLKRADTVVVIGVTEDKKILLIEEEQPDRPKSINAVAGKVEEGETMEEGARREFLEETGYSFDELIPWYQNIPEHKIIWKVCTFIARGCKKVAEPDPEPGERISLKFFSFDEFMEAVLEEKVRSLYLKMHILEAKYDSKKMKELKEKFGV